jgi:DNA repair protein RAD50
MNPDNEANPGGPSSLGKLMIRGVRSFDPNRDEAIEFYSPLTMIVGANGCGKTTIIECLKFATTGLMPPGANKGQSFVNDPGMTDSVEVKASIKLRFNNAANEVCILQRSMQLTKKKVKLEFKQLDGTVKMKDHENKLTSLSYKCADLDRYIPQLLNVSPAILENVIFCHQEESSWPMLEGSVLKKKFDDILESSRYTKALDALLKLKKEYALVAKDHKAELMQAVVYLENAKTLQEELDSTFLSPSLPFCLSIAFYLIIIACQQSNHHFPSPFNYPTNQPTILHSLQVHRTRRTRVRGKWTTSRPKLTGWMHACRRIVTSSRTSVIAFLRLQSSSARRRMHSAVLRTDARASIACTPNPISN